VTRRERTNNWRAARKNAEQLLLLDWAASPAPGANAPVSRGGVGNPMCSQHHAHHIDSRWMVCSASVFPSCHRHSSNPFFTKHPVHMSLQQPTNNVKMLWPRHYNNVPPGSTQLHYMFMSHAADQC
jgi:hypothetical protein